MKTQRARFGVPLDESRALMSTFVSITQRNSSSIVLAKERVQRIWRYTKSD
jgi:hypothetical protein